MCGEVNERPAQAGILKHVLATCYTKNYGSCLEFDLSTITSTHIYTHIFMYIIVNNKA